MISVIKLGIFELSADICIGSSSGVVTILQYPGFYNDENEIPILGAIFSFIILYITIIITDYS